MVKNPENSVCIVGATRVKNQNPINVTYQLLIGSFLIDPSDGTVLDVEFNTICKVTNDFMAGLMIGRSMYQDVEDICEQIQRRYMGESKKSFQVVVKDAAEKLRQLVLTNR